MVSDSIIDAVLVLYKPDLPKLNRVIQSIYKQVRTVYLINNSDEAVQNSLLPEFSNTTEVLLCENLGIAYAQNVGIAKSLENGCNFTLLSDQDTEYPPDFVAKALASHEADDMVGVVVPVFNDLNGETGRAPLVFKTRTGFRSQIVETGKCYVFHAIASGMVIEASVFQKVGKMDEDLFIDWVDLEWCWRLDRAGIKVLADADLVVEHILGDSKKNIGFRDVPLRSALRHYYITRNAFFLALYTKELNRIQRIRLFLRSFRYLLGFPILSRNKLLNLKYVAIGFFHGVTKRLGRYDP